MNKPKTIVLDSWPMMAYLQGESAAESVVDIIADAHANGDELIMSVINAGEIWYSIAKRADSERADEAIDLIRSLGIKFIDVVWETTQIAAQFKAKGGIAYADCFAAALAKVHSSPPARGGVAPASGDEVVGAGRAPAVLITGDREFKQLEKEITINWLTADR